MTQATKLSVKEITARLAADLSATATTLTLETGKGAAFPASNFQIEIGSETILVGTRSSDTFSSLTRGVEGTTGAPHNRGDAVAYVIGAQAIVDQATAVGTATAVPPFGTRILDGAGGGALNISGINLTGKTAVTVFMRAWVADFSGQPVSSMLSYSTTNYYDAGAFDLGFRDPNNGIELGSYAAGSGLLEKVFHWPTTSKWHSYVGKWDRTNLQQRLWIDTVEQVSFLTPPGQDNLTGGTTFGNHTLRVGYAQAYGSNYFAGHIGGWIGIWDQNLDTLSADELTRLHNGEKPSEVHPTGLITEIAVGALPDTAGHNAGDTLQLDSNGLWTIGPVTTSGDQAPIGTTLVRPVRSFDGSSYLGKTLDLSAQTKITISAWLWAEEFLASTDYQAAMGSAGVAGALFGSRNWGIFKNLYDSSTGIGVGFANNEGNAGHYDRFPKPTVRGWNNIILSMNRAGPTNAVWVNGSSQSLTSVFAGGGTYTGGFTSNYRIGEGTACKFGLVGIWGSGVTLTATQIAQLAAGMKPSEAASSGLLQELVTIA